MMSGDWARQWVDGYESGRLDALRDRPRAGKPPKVMADKLAKIIADAYKKWPLLHDVGDAVKRKTGVVYNSKHIWRIMRGHNLSPKKLEYVHVNHADPAAVRKWQEREKRVVAYYRHKGRTVGWRTKRTTAWTWSPASSSGRRSPCR